MLLTTAPFIRLLQLKATFEIKKKVRKKVINRNTGNKIENKN